MPKYVKSYVKDYYDPFIKQGVQQHAIPEVQGCGKCISKKSKTLHLMHDEYSACFLKWRVSEMKPKICFTII